MSIPDDTTFKPPLVSDWFHEIVQWSHGSGQEDPLRRRIYGWLTKDIGIPSSNIYYDEISDDDNYDPDSADAGKRVIRVTRPGRSGLQPIVLQAHMDMVVVTDPVVTDVFPLKLQSSDGQMTALAAASTPENPVHSTLGADDGIGLATALALLQDQDLADMPLECLFTVQEETNMGGATYFDLGLLRGRAYINLDAEDAGTIIYGSAGGFETTYSSDIARAADGERQLVDIELSGLRGGHSGVDIGKGRPSALALLGQVLRGVNARINDWSGDSGVPPSSFDYLLVDLVRTDTIKPNAIPRSARATIAIAITKGGTDLDDLRVACNRWCHAFNGIYAGHETVKLEVDTNVESTSLPLSATDTDRLLELLDHLPQGVIATAPDLGVVETSSNIYDVELDSTTMTIETSTRTSNVDLLGPQDAYATPLQDLFRNLGAVYGHRVSFSGWYPAWQPNRDSRLLARACEVFTDIYGAQCTSAVIHAGLECGWMVTRYAEAQTGDMDCISVGPTIANPHTTSETLYTDTVDTFYRAVKELLLGLFADQGSR